MGWYEDGNRDGSADLVGLEVNKPAVDARGWLRAGPAEEPSDGV